MFYDKIQICENHLIDLSNDEFEGCPVCEMQSEINRLKKIIKELKTPTEPVDKLQKYKEALELIAKTGCIQSAEGEEFFCKKDGSEHSVYCPAGIAQTALQPADSEDTGPPHPLECGCKTGPGCYQCYELWE